MDLRSIHSPRCAQNTYGSQKYPQPALRPKYLGGVQLVKVLLHVSTALFNEVNFVWPKYSRVWYGEGNDCCGNNSAGASIQRSRS